MIADDITEQGSGSKNTEKKNQKFVTFFSSL